MSAFGREPSFAVRFFEQFERLLSAGADVQNAAI